MALFIPPVVRATDASNHALSGAQWFFYLTGTTTPASVYSDSTLATPLSNPVTADSGGLFASIYLDPTVVYRAILKTSGGSTVKDIDPVNDGLSITTAGTVTYRFSGTPFTNAAYYSNIAYLTNGATPGSWYSALQGGENATEAFTAAVTVPSDATAHQTNAGAFYVRSDRAQPGNGGDVAIYGQAVSNANSSAVFSMNLLMADTVGKTAQILSNEIDINVFATDTVATGLNVVLSDSVGGAGARNAIRLDKAGTNGWLNGFVTADGSISGSGYAVFVGAASNTTLTDRDSQPIALVSYKSDNTRFIGTVIGDHLGGIAVRPGNALAAVAFQPPDGSVNWFSVAASGTGYPIGMGGAITQITSRTTAVTINKVCGAITLVSAAGSASWQTFTVNNSLVAANDTIRVSQKSGTDKLQLIVSRTASGAFDISFATTGGTTTEQPVLNFSIWKGANS